jgi:predicted methyltransferase
MTEADPPSAARRGLRLLPLLLVGGLVSFIVGTRSVGTRPAHPLTGRPIPGIATDTAWMDRAERGREEEPDRALRSAGIVPGMTVADVGAGSGYMTIRIARLVGPTGKVFANELQPRMVQLIRERIARERLDNVEVVQGTEDDARLPIGAVDMALLVDVYHELRRPQAMLASVRDSLRPTGRLVLIEYRQEDPGIPIASLHRMSLAGLRAEVEPVGFRLDRVEETLPRQHIALFRRAR